MIIFQFYCKISPFLYLDLISNIFLFYIFKNQRNSEICFEEFNQTGKMEPAINIGQGTFKFDHQKTVGNSNAMDADEYGLVDDIFLVNELNSSFTNSSGDSSPLNSTDDDLVELMKSAVDERKPFESFEKQITITVPQPPPLKADDFSIGGGLFDGNFNINFFPH